MKLKRWGFVTAVGLLVAWPLSAAAPVASVSKKGIGLAERKRDYGNAQLNALQVGGYYKIGRAHV